MKRKSKELIKEKQEALKRLKEVEELEALSLKEDADRLENVTNEITKVCEKNDMFCGVILTQQDILEIIKVAMDSKQNVSIPFKVYYKE